MLRPSLTPLQAISLRLQAQGPQTALELAASLGVTRGRIAQLLGQATRSIEQIGQARRARYAMRRAVRTAGDTWPIYQIDEEGRAHDFGQLDAFHGGWRVRWTEPTPAWARLVTDEDGWSEGFPFFLGDARPQGFIGRAIARRVTSSLALPNNPAGWGDDDVVTYLQAEGDDLTGNFVLGDGPMGRVLTRAAASSAFVSPADYPALAASAMEGGPPGSSAGGEHPKFLTRVADGEGVRPVLVKFSTTMENPVGRRWADLLLAEAVASRILAENHEGVPDIRVLDLDRRRFLEVPRFDRIGPRGRRGVVSLAGLQASADSIHATNWVGAAEHFEAVGVLGPTTVTSIRRRQAFGELIGNSDMHPGNLAFFLDAAMPLQLTPSYDMLPMWWVPLANGEIVDRDFNPSPPMPRLAGDWSAAAEWADRFWQELAADSRLSAKFAKIARSAGEKVARLRREYGLS